MAEQVDRPYHNVKMRPDAFERLTRLVNVLSQRGWAAAGIVQADRVSNLSVLDAALKALEIRIKERK